MLTSLISLVAFFIAFGVGARLWPCNPGQRAFVTRDLADNMLWWMLGLILTAFIYGDLATAYIRAGANLLAPQHAAAIASTVLAGYGWAARLPLAVQALALLFAMDVAQYWLHRAYHSAWLWPFHAVHHSAEELDWSATFRIHPGNFVVYSAGALALVRLIGFSPAALAIVGPFNLVYGALVHANLNWTFGPFRYVIASPVYHRWHHVKDPKVHNRNFAPTFPVLDVMFGTLHMPKHQLPSDYGVEGASPHFVGQLVSPFVEIAARLGLPRRAGAGEAAA
jgi:sterol desaturase/sphingolipid hydroxylase (fatty acid hydroxylase superfamily)